MAELGLSVTIITYNEEARIGRALDSVKWASEVVVCDSGSTDRTREIAAASGARVVSRHWEGYGQQKNFAQSQCVNDWVLNIDADEEVTPELRDEIRALFAAQADPSKVYRIKRRTYFGDRWIRFGGWYPNAVARLGNRKHSRWTEPEIHEELKASGGEATLVHPMNHFSFDGALDQAAKNVRYAELCAREDIRRGRRGSILKLLFKPYWKFFESYALRLGVLDGLPGLLIAKNAAHSMFLRQAKLIERERKS